MDNAIKQSPMENARWLKIQSQKAVLEIPIARLPKATRFMYVCDLLRV